MQDKNRVHNRILRTLMTIMMVAALIVSSIPAWALEDAGNSADALNEKEAAAAASNEEETTAAEESVEETSEEAAEETSEESDSGEIENTDDSAVELDAEEQPTEEAEAASDDSVSEEETLTEEEVSETTEEEPATMAQPKVRLRSSTRSGSGTKTITVTKRWVNDDDSVRPDNLTIHVKQKISVLIEGRQLAYKMKLMSGSGSGNTGYDPNTTVTAIKYATDAQYQAKKSSLTGDNVISQSGTPSYAWFENGTIYIYSEADNIFMNSNSGYAFNKYRNLTDISGLSKLNTYYVTDMNRMFQDTTGLVDISPLSGWDVGNVTNMDYTFGANYYQGSTIYMSINDISPLSSWDVSNVQGFYATFKCAPGITSVDAIKGWDVGNATTMKQMFNRATLSDASELINWDVKCVSDFEQMLANNGLSVDDMPIFNNRPGTWSSAGHYYPVDDPVTPITPPTPAMPTSDIEYSDNGYGSADCTVTKNGNVWTYTFTVPDNGGKWSVWEETDSQGKYLNDKNGLADAYTESSNNTDGLGGSEANAIKNVTDSAAITNTNTKRKEITVTKNWKDNNNAAGVRPTDKTKVNLHLKLNGSDKMESNNDPSKWTESGNTWTYTFVHYSGNQVTDYSVSEDNVQFYDSDGYAGKQVMSSGGPLPDTGKVEITNEYKAYDLTISKEVTGNQGDKTKEFDVSVNISGVVPNKAYTVTKGGTPDAPDTVTSDSSGNISATIKLKDTDSVRIEGIPKNATYDVSEAYGDYDPNVTVTGDSSATTGAGSASGTISDNTGIKFTNDKSGILPTGLFSDSNPLVIMLAVALLGIIILLMIAIRKRRAADYE